MIAFPADSLVFLGGTRLASPMNSLLQPTCRSPENRVPSDPRFPPFPSGSSAGYLVRRWGAATLFVVDVLGMWFSRPPSFFEEAEPVDSSTPLLDWFYQGAFNPDRKIFDCGIQTRAALQRLSVGVPPDRAAPVKNKITGTVLLCAPLPLALWHSGSDEELYKLARRRSLVTHATCARNSAALFMCYGPGNCSSATAMAGTWRRLTFSTWGTKTKLPLKNPSSSLWILIAIPRAARDTFSIHFGLLTSPCANRTTFPSSALRSPLEMTPTQLPA